METYSITFRNGNQDLRTEQFELNLKTTDQVRDYFDDMFGLKTFAVANIKDM